MSTPSSAPNVRVLPTARNPVVDVPAATTAMFTGLLGDIVTAADPTTEADPVGVLASLLAGTGALIGPGPHVRIGNTPHPLLVWPLLFGRTGSGRKGEAGGTAATFLRTAGGDDWRRISVTGLSSGEGLIERLRDARDENDTAGSEDKRLLVEEPEFASVMARSRRESSTLPAVLRQAWDGRALHVLNRQALAASASHVSIIGHITPKEFRVRLAEADMAGGTFNRFLPIYVERSKRLPLPPGLDNDVVAQLGAQLREAIGRAKRVGRIVLDQQATDFWCTELYEEFTEADDDDAAWTEFARRSAPYCLRIAGLYAALQGRSTITTADLGAAGALTRYSVASAKYVLDRQMRDPRIDRLRRAIDQAGREGLSKSEVARLFSGNLKKDVLAELIKVLMEDGEYELVTVPTKGRPAERYRRVPMAR